MPFRKSDISFHEAQCRENIHISVNEIELDLFEAAHKISTGRSTHSKNAITEIITDAGKNLTKKSLAKMRGFEVFSQNSKVLDFANLCGLQAFGALFNVEFNAIAFV